MIRNLPGSYSYPKINIFPFLLWWDGYQDICQWLPPRLASSRAPDHLKANAAAPSSTGITPFESKFPNLSRQHRSAGGRGSKRRERDPATLFCLRLSSRSCLYSFRVLGLFFICSYELSTSGEPSKVNLHKIHFGAKFEIMFIIDVKEFSTSSIFLRLLPL